MKKKIFTSLFAALMLLGVGVMGTSCGDDTPNIHETEWGIVPITVNSSHWKWNAEQGYYEASYDVEALDEAVFREGAVMAYFKFDKNGKTALPYTQAFQDENGKTYSRYISCDFSLGNPSKVTFYLQMSDMANFNDAPPTMDFDVVVIY